MAHNINDSEKHAHIINTLMEMKECQQYVKSGLVITTAQTI